MADVEEKLEGEPPAKICKLDDETCISSVKCTDTASPVAEVEAAVDDDTGAPAEVKVRCTRLETEVGITEYISTHQGFTAVIKQRFSDFLVNEIGVDGNLIQLTDIDSPTCDIEEEKPPNPEVSELLNEDQIEQLKVVENEKTGEVFIQVADNKEKRTKIHSLVRDNFTDLASSTIEKDGERCIRVFSKSEPDAREDYNKRGGRERKRKPAWPRGRPDYCQFVMYKENRDTPDAINFIAKMLRMGAGQFTYAGTKDRRAKTTQLVTVFRLSATRLYQLNKRLKHFAVGNFEYVKTPLKLGMLKGNHFTIVLRNVTGTDEQITAGISSLKSTGFINYFGMQRFGTSTVPTHHIGRSILQNKWSEVIDLILQPRDDFISKAREVWKESGDAQAALKHLQHKTCIERHLLTGLSKCAQNDIVGALNYIPRNSRQLYLHSYQSFVWNSMVSVRIQKYGLEPIVGDVVIPNSAEVTEGDSHVQVEILTNDNKDSYTIYDVVMPLPGYDVIPPKNDIGEDYKEILQKDSLDFDSFKHKVKDYAMPGGYRKILVKPTDVSHQIIPYDDYQVSLTQSDLDKLNGIDMTISEDGQYKAIKLELSLPRSTYATMALRELLKCDTSASYQMTLNSTANT